MKRIKLTALLTAAFYAVFSFSQALAAFSFSDTRFQNVLTTENLHPILRQGILTREYLHPKTGIRNPHL